MLFDLYACRGKATKGDVSDNKRRFIIIIK